MNVLVVGGAGFIGSHTCYALRDAGYTPIIYDNFSSGFKDLITPFECITGDIHNTDYLIQVLKEKNIHAVFHFAAFISVGDSVANPIAYYENNVMGSLSLFKAIAIAGVPHVIISSTAAVYGTPTNILPVTEKTPLSPLSPYAESKIMMEHMMEDITKAYPVSFASLRYFNAAGADSKLRTGQRHIPTTQIIPRLFMAITGDIPTFSLFGTDYPTPDGTCIRDYIHVSDLASAHISALRYLENNANTNIICNLGTNSGTSNRELIAKVEEITKKKVPLVTVARREGDPAYVIADAQKAYAELGWKPLHSSLENIVHTAWEWFIRDREKYPRS